MTICDKKKVPTWKHEDVHEFNCVLLKHHMYEEEPEDTELDDSLSKSQELNEGELKWVCR